MQTKNDMTALDEKAEAICRWAAARATMVAGNFEEQLLKVNEANMIIRIGNIYGVDVTRRSAADFIHFIGGGAYSASGTLFWLFPLPVVTYAMGKSAQAWIQDGMPVDMEKYKGIFRLVHKEAKTLTDELSCNPLKRKPLGEEKWDYFK